MIAYRLLKPQSQPDFQEVPAPHAGPGQVVLKVAGCGLCHTDISVAGRDPAFFADTPPPFTLGHEIAGWVAEMGSGVTGFQHGDPVAVLPVWHSCGRCHACRSGQENFCFYVTHLMGAGVGFDGGLAPYVLVPETRYLVPIGDLDPVAAAPLTDAGLTTYTAIKPVLPMLYPGSTAVVIGVGGLGLLGVELLRQLCATRVIAVDTSEARLQLATENGADHALLSDACAPAQIREITQGIGAQLVLDCVGAEATIAMGAAALARQGRLTVVGAAGGEFPFEFHKVPWGSQIATSLNGGTANLKELLDMAALGRFKSIVDRYPLSQVKQAYDDMQHGRLKGRAVAIPE